MSERERQTDRDRDREREADFVPDYGDHKILRETERLRDEERARDAERGGGDGREREQLPTRTRARQPDIDGLMAASAGALAGADNVTKSRGLACAWVLANQVPLLP